MDSVIQSQSTMRVILSRHDSEGKGYLREADLECYVYELIPTLAPLHSEEAAITVTTLAYTANNMFIVLLFWCCIQENFYPFYVFTAVRRFFFFLDPRRTGRCNWFVSLA